MGCSKPNNEDNPTKQSLEPAITGTENEASDSSHISNVNNAPAFVSFRFGSFPNSHWENAHGMHQPYTDDPRILNNVPGPGLMRPHTPQPGHSQPSPLDFRGMLSYEGAWPGTLRYPTSDISFVPNPSIVPGDYYRNADVGGQASLQGTGSSLYSGYSPSFPQSTRGGTFADNDAKANASNPGNFDERFLTLGIEGHNLSGSSSFQSNRAALPGSMHSSLGAIGSHTIQSSHHPQACGSSGRNLGIASRPQGTYQGTGTYNHSEVDPTSVLSSFSNAYSSNFHPGLGQASNLTSESAKLTGTAFQTTQSQPQNYNARNVRDATSANVTGVHVTQDYLGHQYYATGYSSATPLRSTPFAGKVLQQTPESTAAVPLTFGSFPRRSGNQSEYGQQSVNRPMDPRMMGNQTRSGVNLSHPTKLTKILHVSPAGAAYPRVTLPHQLNVRAPSISTGPESVSAKTNRPSMMFNPVPHPSHKREAVAPPPVASLGQQRRRLIPPSTLTAASVAQKLGTPAPVHSETLHIKWQGPEKDVELLGHKCYICKRDLAFEPGSTISLPSSMPQVAVLPCGHTFHDQCLEQITPKEEATDPPCIPCAIGE